jgi:carbonyl reductase 1
MSRIAIVTGANQGLGFALAQGLAQQLTHDDVVYLTGRDPDRVRGAAERVARSRPRSSGSSSTSVTAPR